MEIDVLSGNTLKLTLDKHDMEDMGLRYETLGAAEQTGWLLRQVLSGVKQTADKMCRQDGHTPELLRFTDFDRNRLFVEAFPRADGGCMMYISGLDTENRVSEMPANSAAAPKNSAVYKPKSVTKPAPPVTDGASATDMLVLSADTAADASQAQAALAALNPPPTVAYRHGCVLTVSVCGERLPHVQNLLREYGGTQTGTAARLTLARAKEHEFD